MNEYVYKCFVKIGGNDNNAQFSKQRGKLPYFFQNKVNYPLILIYGSTVWQWAGSCNPKLCRYCTWAILTSLFSLQRWSATVLYSRLTPTKIDTCRQDLSSVLFVLTWFWLCLDCSRLHLYAPGHGKGLLLQRHQHIPTDKWFPLWRS